MLWLLVACIAAKCEQYATQETCLDNCWCAWRTGLWQQPDACIPFSAAGDCNTGDGVICVDNESHACYVADAAILFVKVVLFVLALVMSAALGLCVICIVVLLTDCVIRAIREELKRRELEQWITYANIAGTAFLVIAVAFVVLTVLFYVFSWVFHMASMLYESSF